MAETKSRKKNKNEGNALTRPFSGIVEYFREVRTEMNKVTWPTREEVIRLTRIVIIVTVIFALVMGGFNIVLSAFVGFGLDQPIVLLVAFVAAVLGVIYMLRRGDTRSSY